MRLPLFSRSTSIGFATMGAQIEARHRRCERWWAPHVRNTREFIAQHVPPGLRVGVLGAGRLIDVDADGLLERSREVHLIDADPGCRSVWRAVGSAQQRKKLVARTEDVTDCIISWSRRIASIGGRSKLAAGLATLRAPRPAWADEPFDLIVSLNLLGQIPLYWRDFVRSAHASLSEHEEEGLALSMGELQSAHLRALFSSMASRVILIFDSEYYFYEASRAEWRVESALFGAAADALRAGAGARALEGSDTWLWHLAPQFVEQEDEGEIHKVEALAFG